MVLQLEPLLPQSFPGIKGLKAASPYTWAGTRHCWMCWGTPWGSRC